MSVELLRRWVRGTRAIASPARLVLPLALLGGCTGSSHAMKEAPAPAADPVAGRATVCFLRPSGMGFGVNFQIWDRDHLLGLAQAKSWFQVQCTPGRHLFIVAVEEPYAVDADLAAGKRYYIVVDAHAGWHGARASMTPVTKGSDAWNDVVEVCKSLQYVVPIDDAIRDLEREHHSDLAAVAQIFGMEHVDQKSIGHLAATDGR